MRVVADTNVVVSGLLWRGGPWKLLRLAKAHRIELCVSPAMLDELAEVLRYPRLASRLHELELAEDEVLAYVAGLVSVFDLPPSQNPAAVIVTADPDDDVFLHCAAAIGASCVVSGDRHLLNLEAYEGIPILTVRDFLLRWFPGEVER